MSSEADAEATDRPTMWREPSTAAAARRIRALRVGLLILTLGVAGAAVTFPTWDGRGTLTTPADDHHTLLWSPRVDESDRVQSVYALWRRINGDLEALKKAAEEQSEAGSHARQALKHVETQLGR